MKTSYSWTKGFFSNLYSIYYNGGLIGNLKDKSFSQTAQGEVNGKEYIFKTKGFLKQHTEIIDSSENRIIGEITYNSWMTKAKITLKDKTINWKYDNAWNTKWSLFDSAGILMNFSGSSSKGQINANVDDELLILAGLFVTNYYWQTTTAVIIAALIPIWISAIN